MTVGGVDVAIQRGYAGGEQQIHGNRTQGGYYSERVKVDGVEFYTTKEGAQAINEAQKKNWNVNVVHQD